MNKTLFVLAVIFLTGCDRTTEERTEAFILPPDLEDCKIFKLSDGSTTITTMRCPNSATSTNYKDGKVHKISIAVDGDAYVQEKKYD